MRHAASLRAALAAVLAAVTGACANAPAVREPPPLPFTGTKWTLITERKIVGEQPYLEFGDGAVSGYSGCNRIMGRYIQDSVGAGAIVFSSLATTKRLCEDAVMAVEERIIAVLRSSTNVKVTGNTLRIDGSAGQLNFAGPPPVLPANPKP